MRTLIILAFLVSIGVADDDTSKIPKWIGDPQNLPAFPKPEPEKAFAAVKIFQSDGSAYRIPLEDWKGARRRMEEDPQWGKWVERQRADVDSWMTQVHDRTEWQAGWNHDFVDPKNGAFLIWTAEVPGEQVKSFHNPSGGEVAVTPKLFNAWVGELRKRNTKMAIEAAKLFRLTGDTRYAEWAAAQLDFYADNYGSWRDTNGPANLAHLGYQSLDDAVLLSYLVETARLLFNWADEPRRQKWYEKLFKPEVDLLDRSHQYIHNIAFWQRCSQAEVALLYNDNAIWQRDVEGKFGVRDQLAKGVTSDYIWYEQSLGYNSFVVMAALPMLKMAGLLGKGSQMGSEAAIIENMMLSPLTLAFPDGTLPNPADNTGIPHVGIGLLTDAYRILPTTIGVRKAISMRSWDTLVDPPEPVPSSAPNTLEVASVSLESTRFALLKQGPWQVFFHYGQLNLSHAQAEALNFSASFDGMDVTHDPGTVGYGSPMSSGFYRQPLAQNVPLFDGKGQKPWSPGKLLSFSAAAATVSAEQPDYSPGVSAKRTLRIEGDALIDEASISSSGPAAKAGLVLNLQGTPQLSADFVSAPDFARDRPPMFGYWKEVRVAAFQDHAEIDLAYGNRILKVEFSIPGNFMVYVASAPDVPPKHRAGFYVETNEAEKEATFTTRISPANSAP